MEGGDRGWGILSYFMVDLWGDLLYNFAIIIYIRGRI
jgi:hypothetical protein